MNAHEEPFASRQKFFTPGTILLLLIFAVGAAFGVKRYVYGIGSVANLDNTFPWGIWKAVNVAAVAAIGSSGFTMTAIVHIFNREKYHSLMRSSLALALLCYSFVGVALLVDLGKYYDIWHPLLPRMWQPNSALFEVAMCVMFYLAVLSIEFAPVVFERFIGRISLPGRLKALNRPADALMRIGDRALRRSMSLFMLLGVVLCCLHQSTLGTLMVIPAYKMHPLWFTPALPLLFLLSATAVGLASAIAASLWTSKAFGSRREMEALTSLARALPLVIGIYLAARVVDLALREQLPLMFDGSARAVMFQFELFGGMAAPCALLMFERVRRSPRALFFASALFILGVTFNRINTYLTAYTPPFTAAHYFPSVGEVSLCLAQIAALMLLYRALVLVFPVARPPLKLAIGGAA